MASKQPFARRILIAFVLMTALVSGVFSLSIVAVVHVIEETPGIRGARPRAEDTVLEEDLQHGRPASGWTPRPGSLASEPACSMRFPSIVCRAAGGLHREWWRARSAFYVYSPGIINGKTYLLAQEQHEFEAREQALFDVVLAGFLLTVVGAWGLGLLTARKVMAPVSRLAQQVTPS